MLKSLIIKYNFCIDVAAGLHKATHDPPQWYIVSYFKITQQFSAPDSPWAFYKITEHKLTIHSFNKQYVIFIPISSFAFP